MKGFLSALWKVAVLTAVFFIVNAVISVLLPLSNGMTAAMTPLDRAFFMPVYLLSIVLNMTMMYLALTHPTYRGWRLFLAV